MQNKAKADHGAIIIDYLRSITQMKWYSLTKPSISAFGKVIQEFSGDSFEVTSHDTWD